MKFEEMVRKILISKFSNDDFTLKSFVVNPVPVGGMMGVYLQLICDVQETPTATSKQHVFFVKQKSPLKHLDDLIDRIFDKEKATLAMFNTINLPPINNAMPQCFYTDEQFLVFEDLLIDGYVLQSPDRVATEEELRVVLKTLAGLHAGGILFEERQSLHKPSPCRILDDFPAVFAEIQMEITNKVVLDYNQALIKGLRTAIAVFDLPVVLESGKRFEDELQLFMNMLEDKTMIQPSSKYRNSICHCDLSPGNIFIRYGEKNEAQQAKIIDYQLERYLPPAFDVLQYLLLSTTRAYRQSNLLKLKQTYFDFFSNFLKEYGIDPLNIYTFEEFLDSFREVECFVLFTVLHLIPLWYNTDEEAKELLTSDSRTAILFEDRSPLFTKFTANAYYMQRIKDCMLDVKDYFESHNC